MVTPRPQKSRIYKIVGLVCVTFPMVWIAVVTLVMFAVSSRNWSELETDQLKYPEALRIVAKELPETQVAYYRLCNGLGTFFTRRGVIRFEEASMVERFIEVSELESVDSSHPKRKEFEEALSLVGFVPLSNGDVWFASPGFGTDHQEIQDLYLLNATQDRGNALAYHFWEF